MVDIIFIWRKTDNSGGSCHSTWILNFDTKLQLLENKILKRKRKKDDFFPTHILYLQPVVEKLTVDQNRIWNLFLISCLHGWWFSTVDCIFFFNVCDRVCWTSCSVVRRTSRWPCCCSSAPRATTSRTPSPSSTTSTTGSTCWTTLWVTRLSRRPHCASGPRLSRAFSAQWEKWTCISWHGFCLIHFSEPEAQQMEDPTLLESSVWEWHPSSAVLIHARLAFCLFLAHD